MNIYVYNLSIYSSTTYEITDFQQAWELRKQIFIYLIENSIFLLTLATVDKVTLHIYVSPQDSQLSSQPPMFPSCLRTVPCEKASYQGCYCSRNP